MSERSVRSRIVALRSYQRPLDDEGTVFETWEQTCRRATVKHHSQLLSTVGKRPLDYQEELEELYQLQVSRKASVAGRTLWLGGTPIAYSRPASQYNCAFTEIRSVYDLVDAAWNLLNGCGQGFRAISGVLSGPQRKLELQITPSTNPAWFRGIQKNEEVRGRVRHIRVGDSAEAWAKFFGKLVMNPPETEKLHLDFSNLRGPGGRLRGYGWICNGYEPLAKASSGIVDVLNRRVGQLLTDTDIGEIVNWIGTVLSSRRSSQIWVMDSFNPLIHTFEDYKKDVLTKPWLAQSNNTEIFWAQPSRSRLITLLEQALTNGDPGIANGEAALRRAPWFKGFNPCAEILLGAFCNLVEVNLPAFDGDDTLDSLRYATFLMARANYRQTCVDLRDGILQPTWHQANYSLRLCGVGLTGICQTSHTDSEIGVIRRSAKEGADSMADELGLPRSKAVTTIKPSGTLSKVMDVSEGIHKPLGRYLFNWIVFSKHDPVLSHLERAGYNIIDKPNDPTSRLVCFPVEFPGISFERDGEGLEVNLEPAIAQLERYKRWVTLWCDHNASCSIYLSQEEVPEVADWLLKNWDSYIAVSFFPRLNPSLKPADVGHAYLPQQVVNPTEFHAYKERLSEPDLSSVHGIHEIGSQECAGGTCPIR